MDWVEFVKVGILAVFQGVAEFLPISSSGHLQVLGTLLHIEAEENLVLTIILHAGSLLAILAVYFKLIWDIIAKREFRLILALIIGTLPLVAVGLGLKATGLDEKIFESLWIPAIGFAITAALLMWAMKTRSEEEEAKAIPLEKIPFSKALLIGIVQGIAITPGISRSGSTISAAMKANLKLADCAKFSFLLAIPAIAGAILLEIIKLFKQPENVSNSMLLLWVFGFVVSAVVSYVSLKLLLGMLQRGKLKYFGWYLVGASCFTFGLWVGTTYYKG